MDHIAKTVARRWAAPEPEFLYEEVEEVEEGIKERTAFVKKLSQVAPLLRGVAEALESHKLASIYTTVSELIDLANQDLTVLHAARQGLLKADHQLTLLTDPQFEDARLYEGVWKQVRSIDKRLFALWDTAELGFIEEMFDPDLKSRVITKLTKAIEAVPSPEDFPPYSDDWHLSDTLIHEVRDWVKENQ